MHMFAYPQCIDPNDTYVLEQVPRRTCGRLEGKVKQHAEGWGLYLQEGPDIQILAALVIIVLVASVLFVILWSYFMHDVQGASGVGSYIVSAVMALVALAALVVGISR
jgi:hypothetical protein